MIRDVGDLYGVKHLVYNDSGVLVDATVTLSVTAPDGTSSSPTVTHASTGTYTADINLTAAGVWSYVWTISGVVQDVSYGQVTAGNPAPTTYTTLTRLKSALNVTNTTNDDYYGLVLDAASRSVEQFCDGRRFYLDRTTSQRVYTLTRRVRCDGWSEQVDIDDIGALGGIVIEVGDGTTWTALTDCEYRPDNAFARNQAITTLVSPSYSFAWNRLLRVTARWGWPSIPSAVENATLLTATRYARRPASPEGVAGSADWGLIRIPNIDPDVQAQLQYLRAVKVA